jgi:tRNA 2-thiouridine synthesizing protein E
MAITFENKIIETDKQGYLLDHKQWCDALGSEMAKRDSMELTRALGSD